MVSFVLVVIVNLNCGKECSPVKQQNEFLKREIELLKSLNSERKCNNDLLEEKLNISDINEQEAVRTNSLSIQQKHTESSNK